jgi:L-alanine-DL-glutamate epimerase-like enolase superfamily enzyme
MMNVGAHLAAALPEVDMVEDSRLDWNKIVNRPIPLVAGQFMLSDDPGHGLSISEDAVREWSR